MRRSLLYLGVLALLLNVNCEAKNEDLESSGSQPIVDHTHIDDEDDGAEITDGFHSTEDTIVASGDQKLPPSDNKDDEDLQGSGSGAGVEPIIVVTKSSTTTTTTTVSTTKALTPCQQLRISSLNLSSYTPQCKENGEFEKVQCRGKNMQRSCWCVNPQGMEITGTMKDREEPDCDFGTNLKTCVFQLVQHNQGLLGAFKASCTPDGEYEPIQCHENTCWCVDKLGNEKIGTLVFLPEKPECRVSTVVPSTTNKTGTTKTMKKTDYVISTMKPVQDTVFVETIKEDNNAIPIDSEEIEDPEMKEEKTNEINDEESQHSPQTAATAQLLLQPGLLAAVIGSAVVGLLCIILLIMFIIYRMRKKDEGSYPLDDQKYQNYTYSKAPEKEFYA